MKSLRERVAAITGAAAGIGRMLAVNLAKEGCHLGLADINRQGLEETAKMAQGYGVRVTTHVVDVSQRDIVEKYAGEMIDQHGSVDILVNNAGVTVVDTLEDVSYEDFKWVIDTNFWGVVHGTKAFLPHLKTRPEAHLVNISSINAMIPFRNNGPYNCSKYAVRGFNETLMQELAGTSVNIISVHPGGIKTGIARHARFHKAANTALGREETAKLFERLAMTSADRAARAIISGIKKNKKRVLIGADARVMAFCKRLFPIGSVTLAGRIIGWAK